jgi:hypothetical protein
MTQARSWPFHFGQTQRRGVEMGGKSETVAEQVLDSRGEG